ncbi:MAG: DUF3788 family protein [Bacteroidota bacterium]|jgi:hypothetical protein|nr:DUF3788 family protein [Bacteroidota bacterium]
MDEHPGSDQTENQPSSARPKKRRSPVDPERTRPDTDAGRGARSATGDPGVPKLPFNDFKHPPTRPEIDLLLGVVPSSELRRFEHQLELMEPRTNWAMHWYENETGWGYRASYKARVLCVLHFYRGFFTVTFSIPVEQEADYLAVKELTPGLRKAFDHYTLSTKMKWFTFHVSTSQDAEALLAMLRLKYADLKKRTGRSGN